MSRYWGSSWRATSIRLALVSVCAGVAVGGWALGSAGTGAPPPPVPVSRAEAAGRSAPVLPVLGAARTGWAPPPAATVGLPVRLRIPAIEVDAPLEALSLGSDGSLDAPAQWGVPGWYSGGPRPGDPGPAVIAGHVDSTSGPAVFYSLSRLRPGDSVYVGVRGGAALHFVVDDIESFAKDRFPTALVYGPLPVPVLRLITCTGAFDRAQRSYVDNLVVSAHLV